jgi:hypothetical protein
MSKPQYIRLTAAASYLGVTKYTVNNYVHKGVNGVKLQTVFVGGSRRTTIEFCDQFVRDSTAAKKGK